MSEVNIQLKLKYQSVECSMGMYTTGMIPSSCSYTPIVKPIRAPCDPARHADDSGR